MITRAFDRSAMNWSYDMYLQSMLSAADIEGLPFGSVFGSVPAHTVSKRHAHQDGEMFIVLAGRAVVVLEDDERELGPGEVVHLSPFGFHEIRNESDDSFDIVSIYWEHIPSAVAALDQAPPRNQLAERTLVFCPPPTPNGGLHLGHLAGPYVRADMLVRALRSMGRDARFVTGTDDHQSHIAAAARLRSTNAAELATAEGDAIVTTLRAASVGCDLLTRPVGDPEHTDRIRELFARVASSPAVKEEERETAYCPTCDLSLHQAFAHGYCPHCSESSDGEICESCGRPNEARELDDLRCRICGTSAETRSERALWLDLNAYAEQLRNYLQDSYTSPDLQTLVERLLDEGLPSYRLARSTDWGVSLGEGQSVDAWVDLALTFLNAAHNESEHNGPAKITLFLGWDNSFYYAVLLPVLAFAVGLAEQLPAAFVTNQFLHLDDEKFSTSRGHVVWADGVLDAVGADVVRLALLRNAPEGRVTRITQERADQLTEDPLYRNSREWLSGFSELTERTDGLVPGTGAWTDAHREFYRYLNMATRQFDGLLLPESFSARGYIDLLECFVTRCTEFRATEEVMRKVPSLAEETRTSLALEYLAAKVFAALAWPVTPELSQRVWDWLGLPAQPVREADWAFLPSGTQCMSPAPSFAPVAVGDESGRS
ncbi:methionyl-tRNA synthetase [Actinopolyspora xinjiangensis]|uniref:Methionyl-tRNA synthetase n=1 Tax=Actinopolyspora xinjiangensis TaxID=405564 RepID=A0A1H0WYZ6_9ACTN|nr:class I tRNA ligase family protein [Actinopolyspora xinjiangensis]SDP95665.1 methionyl-tRNA synthetase [Actinopolyspora xinjiangensis]